MKNENPRYVYGIDIGAYAGSIVIAIIDATHNKMVSLNVYKHTEISEQVKRIRYTCTIWKPDSIHIETNGLCNVVIEQLMNEALPIRPFITTPRSKKDVLSALDFSVRNNELILDTFGDLPMKPNHQIAVALAWHGVRNGRVRVNFA